MTTHGRGYDAAEVQFADDCLDRRRLAADLAELIQTTPSNWSVRIGLFGKWGEGKTTVLRFLQGLLSERRSIVFTFSPWAVQNWNDLWEEFGTSLSEALESEKIELEQSWKTRFRSVNKWLEDSGAGKVLNAAAGAAASMTHVPGVDKVQGAAFGALSKWLKYDGEQIAKIRESLGDERRIVVLIDDLDRCDPMLIPQLLLALRELLDLPGFAFVLAFDDEIVAEALTQRNRAWKQGADFLEKILDFRFHLPPITEKQKKSLTDKSIEKYCRFVPPDWTAQIQDLLPNNPRKLKALIRSMAALKPQLLRHDPEELNWVDVWLAQMVRLESNRIFERLLQPNVLENEIGPGYQLRNRRSQDQTKKEDESESFRQLLREEGIEDPELEKRLLQLVVAARARSSVHVRYMWELALRPHALTWKEFDLFLTQWRKNPRPETIATWINEHARNRNVSADEVEDELFEAIRNRRNNLLSKAAGTSPINEHEECLRQTKLLLKVMKQFLHEPGKLSAPRFKEIYDQFGYWIAFRKNKSDQMARENEERMLMGLLSAVSGELAPQILEHILPRSYDFYIGGDGSRSMRDALRERCLEKLAPKAAKESLRFFLRKDGIRTLTEPGRFLGIKYCLFDSQSPIRTGKLRTTFLALILRGLRKWDIYNNIIDYFQFLVRAATQGSGEDFIQASEIQVLVKDTEFIRRLWTVVVSREIQYRMQMRFIEDRQALISLGADETALPMPAVLTTRLAEEQARNSNPIQA